MWLWYDFEVEGCFLYKWNHPNLACPCIYWTIPTKNLATPSPSPHANPHLKPWWIQTPTDECQCTPTHLNQAPLFMSTCTFRAPKLRDHGATTQSNFHFTWLRIWLWFPRIVREHIPIPKRTLVDLAPISNCCLVISRNIQFSHKIPIRTVGCWLPKNDQIYQIIGKAISYDPIWTSIIFPYPGFVWNRWGQEKLQYPPNFMVWNPIFPKTKGQFLIVKT